MESNQPTQKSIASTAEVSRKVMTPPDAAIRIESITLSPEWQKRLSISTDRPQMLRSLLTLKKSG